MVTLMYNVCMNSENKHHAVLHFSWNVNASNITVGSYTEVIFLRIIFVFKPGTSSHNTWFIQAPFCVNACMCSSLGHSCE